MDPGHPSILNSWGKIPIWHPCFWTRAPKKLSTELPTKRAPACVVGLYRGWQTAQLYGDYFINPSKDPDETSQYFIETRSFFFRGSTIDSISKQFRLQKNPSHLDDILVNISDLRTPSMYSKPPKRSTWGSETNLSSLIFSDIDHMGALKGDSTLIGSASSTEQLAALRGWNIPFWLGGIWSPYMGIPIRTNQYGQLIAIHSPPQMVIVIGLYPLQNAWRIQVKIQELW